MYFHLSAASSQNPRPLPDQMDIGPCTPPPAGVAPGVTVAARTGREARHRRGKRGRIVFYVPAKAELTRPAVTSAASMALSRLPRVPPPVVLAFQRAASVV